MDFLTTALGYILVGWAVLFLCTLPVLAALIRSSQLSRAEESGGELEPNESEGRQVRPVPARGTLYNNVGSLQSEKIVSARSR